MLDVKEKININTIAKLAGVSTTTISNFINCTETFPISREKRERIMEVMRSTNYRPSSASSRLRRNSILPGKAVFIFGGHPECNPFDTCKNPMLDELISCLGKVLRDRLGLSMEIRAVEDEDSMESWNEIIADAEAVINYGKLDRSLFELTMRRNTPLGLISDCKTLELRGMNPPPSPLDYVYWDAASHLDRILNYVVGKGARRLAFVSSWNIESNHPVGYAVEAESKIAEFKEFVAAHSGLSGELFCPPMPENISSFYEGRHAYEAIRNKDLRSFDAVLGHNDFVAQGIVWALLENGIAPGRDIMVCGEGDYIECRHTVPTVTTVSYDKNILAETVCDILRRRMANNQPQGDHILIPSYLLKRESTAGNAASCPRHSLTVCQ